MTHRAAIPSGEWKWPKGRREKRWLALGRYYAMFPAEFCYEHIRGLSWRGEGVLDPFCGRGNMPYLATALGRRGWGTDVNPIAWLWTAAKLRPERDLQKVIERIEEVGRKAGGKRLELAGEFAEMAWCEQVRRFLETAREVLEWRTCRTDRMVMALTTMHMHDALEHGLSNQMGPTIGCSAEYAVRWWRANGMETPPEVDPVELLVRKAQMRYQHGCMEKDGGTTRGPADAAYVLARRGRSMRAQVLATSPPYCGVTDYTNDHWLRLWMLGGEFRKVWTQSRRYGSQSGYRELLRGVWSMAKRHLTEGASIVVRSDQRKKTSEVCRETLREAWPGKIMLSRSSEGRSGTGAAHGRGRRKASETDILLCERERVLWALEAGYEFAR